MTPTIPTFDTLNTVMNLARTRLNDVLQTIQPVGGRILQNTQDFTLTVCNGGWWRLQEYLADLGDTQFKQEVIIPAIPALPNTQFDPASQIWISQAGFFDSVDFHVSPALPADLSHPLKIWERWSGQNMPFSDSMECFMDGIPNWNKTTAMRGWEWRQNRIYTPGSQQVEDLKIRYMNYMLDFADSGTTPWFQQPVLVTRSRDALAWFICAEFAEAQEAKDPLHAKAKMFLDKAETAASKIFNRDVVMKQRTDVRRQSTSGRGRQGQNWSWF